MVERTLVAIAAIAFFAAGCGNDASPVCAAGSAQACVGADACAGEQACLDDGSGWTACVCEAPADAGMDAGPPPSDQCIGASDLAILSPYLVDGGTGVSSDFSDILRVCAQSDCIDELLNGTSMEIQTCMSDCYDASAIAGLSSGCQDCWTESILCGAELCTLVCLGTDPDGCDACIATNCGGPRDECTGL